MDWQVGDLAVCVDAADCTPLIEGASYTVSDLNADWVDEIGLGLELAEIAPAPGYCGFLSTRFRKILPDKHEECEPEFITLLKRSKRKVTA